MSPAHSRDVKTYWILVPTEKIFPLGIELVVVYVAVTAQDTSGFR